MLRTLKAFVLTGACFAGGLVAGTAVATTARARGANPYSAFDTLARALTTIEGQYVEPVDDETLLHGAVEGMVSHLDPHSVFLDPDDYRQLKARTDGRFFGIGIIVDEQARPPRITRVVPGGPADLAGVRSGDLIRQVDGVAISEESPAVGSLLTGERGEPVQLGLDRDGAQLTISIVRDKVVEVAVEGELFEPGWAYVRIDHFRRRVGAELRKLVADLEAEGGRPLEGIVLDVRDNPGGLLDEAVEVVDLFLGEGLIVETRGRDEHVLKSWSATPSDDDISTRLVVLVDGNSASAAEIVAGALQDHDRARLVGTPTYGKGSVQQVYELEDGSALKLTVARYVLPDGEIIEDRVGIVPDVAVRPAGASSIESLASRLSALDIDPALRDELVTEVEQIAASPDAPPPLPLYGPLDQRLGSDRPLEKAWQIIRAAD